MDSLAGKASQFAIWTLSVDPKAYTLSSNLGIIFRTCTSKEVAFKKLALWYNAVEECGIDSFKAVARSIQTHYLGILNFFNNRSTNASAESFNAKIKAFRSTSRGVRDISFFLFRLAKLYAWNPYLSPQVFRLIPSPEGAKPARRGLSATPTGNAGDTWVQIW